MKEKLEEYWSDKRVLSISAGLLFGFSFPPLPLPILLIPAWILLFRLAEITVTRREAACWSYITFIIWNLITTYWLMMATPAGGIAAVLANSAVMTLPFVLQREFQNKVSPFLAVLLQAAAWVSYEFLHHQWDLAWPWLALGNAWANLPALIQYISLTGYLGISFWVLLIAGFTFRAIRLSDRTMAAAAVGTALLFPAISLVQYRSTTIESNKSVEAVVAQPNFDTYHDFGGYDNAYEALDVLTNLSDSVRTDSTDLVVWPESGIRTTIYSRKSSNPASNDIKQQLMDRADSWNTTLITGAVYVEFFTEDNAPPLSHGTGTNPYLYYNAALGFFPGQTLEVYRKYNLVPIVERVPFIQFLNAIDIFRWIDWTGGQGYGKGEDPVQFKAGGTSTPALICYDSVFPGWIRKYVKQDAGFLTIITNDGWWGNTSGHHQHFAYARLRAVEFRRWVVRSANNGISGIIDPFGEVKVKTNYWKKTAFRYQVPILSKRTFYARRGDWLPVIMMILTASGALFLVNRREMNVEY